MTSEERSRLCASVQNIRLPPMTKEEKAELLDRFWEELVGETTMAFMQTVIHTEDVDAAVLSLIEIARKLDFKRFRYAAVDVLQRDVE